jgi:hypothetical protein
MGGPVCRSTADPTSFGPEGSRHSDASQLALILMLSDPICQGKIVCSRGGGRGEARGQVVSIRNVFEWHGMCANVVRGRLVVYWSRPSDASQLALAFMLSDPI